MEPNEPPKRLTVCMKIGDDSLSFVTSMPNLPVVLQIISLLGIDFFPYMTVNPQGDCTIQFPGKPEFGEPIGVLYAMPDLDNAKNSDIPQALLFAKEVGVLGLRPLTLIELRTANIRYIYELLEKTEQDLKGLRLGAETVRDIKRRLVAVSGGKIGLNTQLHPAMRYIAMLSIARSKVIADEQATRSLQEAFRGRIL